MLLSTNECKPKVASEPLVQGVWLSGEQEITWLKRSALGLSLSCSPFLHVLSLSPLCHNSRKAKKTLFLIFVTWYTWRGQVDDTSVSSSLPPFKWDPAAAKDDTFWRKNWKTCNFFSPSSHLFFSYNSTDREIFSELQYQSFRLKLKFQQKPSTVASFFSTLL